MDIEVFEAFGGLSVNEREVKEGSEAGGAGSEEIVGRDVELSGDGKRRRTEEVDDEGADGGMVGDGEKGLVEVGIIEAEELENEGFEVGRVERIKRKRYGGKVEEGDGREGGGDAGEIRGGGAGVVGRSDDEDGDGE